MGSSERDNQLRHEFAPLIEELGFAIVELQSAVVSGRTHIELVIYRKEGVSIGDVAAVHKVVLPRTEALLDDRDVALQVASPGIDRVFKSNDEFRVFTGRGVSVLRRDSEEWTGGIIAQIDDSAVTLSQGTGSLTIAFSDVQKARLDYSQEVT